MIEVPRDYTARPMTPPAADTDAVGAAIKLPTWLTDIRDALPKRTMPFRASVAQWQEVFDIIDALRARNWAGLVSDEDMRHLLEAKDVGTGRGRLQRILRQLAEAQGKDAP
jgi:hypothetical protein